MMQNETVDYWDFGPLADQDPDYFHFTPLFADTVLSVVPTTLVLGASVVRIVSLWGKQDRLQGPALQYSKLSSLCFYACCQLALSVCWVTRVSSPPWSAVLAVNLSLTSAIAFCILSYLDHTRSIRPSSILLLYLFFSTGFDILHLRASWHFFSDSAITDLTIASIVLKSTCLVLEAVEKAPYLPRDFQEYRPEELSSILNKGVFFWLNKLMYAGARSVLVPSSLYKLDRKLSSDHLTPAFIEVWQAMRSKKRSHGIARALLSTLKGQISRAVLPRLALLALTVCQPILVQKMLELLQHAPDAESATKGHSLVAAYSLTFFGIAVSSGFYWHSQYRTLSMVRGCLVGALNWQVARIDLRSANDPKDILTLMSADVDRVTEGLRDLHEFWANTLQIVAVTYLLSTQLGFAAFVPIVVACIATTAVTFTSKATGPRQKRWMEAVEQRVSLTSSMLSSMKEVKMKGLSILLTRMTQDLRAKELRLAASARVLVIITNVFAWSPDLVSPTATFIVFYLQARSSGTTFDSAKAFTSLSLIILLAQQLKRSFISLPPFFAAIACLRRIERFMCAEEYEDLREVSLISIPPPTVGANTNGKSRNIVLSESSSDTSCFQASLSDITIRVTNGHFGWTHETDVLKDINVTFPTAKLTCILGPVASGKSTLCKALLGELRASRGKVEVVAGVGGIAFCDQTAHLSNQSIRQNVVGFAAFEQSWYETVIASVALEEDISTLREGDQTIVGTGGSNLSGGQRQKVALARALYARKQIVVLDDVFSGFDANSAKHIAHHVLSPCGLARKHGLTVIFATHTVNLLLLADHVVVLDGSGQITAEGSLSEVRRQSAYVQSLHLKEDSTDEATPQQVSKSVLASKSALGGTTTAAVMQDKSRQTGDFAVYRFYFRAAGVVSGLILCCMAVGFSASYNTPTVWLKAWADAATRDHGPGNLLYPTVYACIQCLALVFLTGLFFQALLVIVTRAGQNLHDISLKTVMSAPLAVFSKNDVGAFTNRFSQDMNLIDVQLAFGVLYLPGVVSLATGQAIVIAISSPWTTITFPFMLMVLYFVQKYYLRTSRQLRFLAIEAKSPLYTHFLESVTGLATLRAFGWTKQTFEVGQNLLDESQRPQYLLYMIRRWLIFVLDTLVACLATVVAAVAITQRINSGFAGVALSQLVTFSQTLGFIIIDWTDVETSIGAVSRIKSFSETTPSEDKPAETVEPPATWPSAGRIEFQNVSSTYDESAADHHQLALKQIDLTISPGEKIGICGRSGSGKSSTILTLLRLLETTAGTIRIDGVDLATTPRATVRARINTLPQHPVFLRGSVRLNLDPTQTRPDADLVDALAKVGLRDALISDGPSGGGLDGEFRPATLSQGQRQLFAMAAAILRRDSSSSSSSPVVLLDEVTSDVDGATDALVQRLIRDEFAACTVVAVAHRLATIVDFDRVVVVADGRFVEVGPPAELLRRPGGAFRALWETGLNHGGGGGGAGGSGHGTHAETVARV